MKVIKYFMVTTIIALLCACQNGDAAVLQNDEVTKEVTSSTAQLTEAGDDSLGDNLKEIASEAEGQVISNGDTVVAIGDKWPDYELLMDIPKPSVGTVSGSEMVEGEMANVILVDMDLAACKEYAEVLAQAGYDQNTNVTDMAGLYTYSADNAQGLHVDLSYVSEAVIIQVSERQ